MANAYLVIGDDHVAVDLIQQLDNVDTTILLSEHEVNTDTIQQYTNDLLIANDITHFISADGTIPDSVFIATSEDSLNLLSVAHILTKSDVNRIVVRLNNPKNEDAFDGFDVSLVDASQIVASGLLNEL